MNPASIPRVVEVVLEAVGEVLEEAGIPEVAYLLAKAKGKANEKIIFAELGPTKEEVKEELKKEVELWSEAVLMRIPKPKS
jgi:hypothetical protein